MEKALRQPHLRALLALVEAVFRPALTTPGFENALVIFIGWVLTSGPHAITAALVATAVSGEVHHEAFHRFFSRGTWDPDEIGHWVFERILRLCGESPIRVAIDDTLATKKGPEVYGLGSHIDAVRSTKKRLIFAFGHVWVMLTVVLPVPFSERTWSLPVLFRLYRNKKECASKADDYDKKTELAREMLDVLATWAPARRIEVAGDSAYCCDTVTRDLPDNFVLIGSMRPDAVLTKPPTKKQLKASKGGRPPKRGAAVPKPEQIARNPNIVWSICEVVLYGGKRVKVHYKTVCAQWYRACGTRLLRIVIVKTSTGAIPYRVFFSTDSNMTVVQILEGYVRRWSIEVCFRDLKQLLGFGDSSARKREAVLRTAPFVGIIYTVLVLWFIEGAWNTELAALPVRPWYRHKRGLCFADVLRAAQRALDRVEVLDLLRDLHDLHQCGGKAAFHDETQLRLAS